MPTSNRGSMASLSRRRRTGVGIVTGSWYVSVRSRYVIVSLRADEGVHRRIPQLPSGRGTRWRRSCFEGGTRGGVHSGRGFAELGALARVAVAVGREAYLGADQMDRTPTSA
jgi:hypothetical protein